MKKKPLGFLYGPIWPAPHLVDAALKSSRKMRDSSHVVYRVELTNHALPSLSLSLEKMHLNVDACPVCVYTPQHKQNNKTKSATPLETASKQSNAARA